MTNNKDGHIISSQMNHSIMQAFRDRVHHLPGIKTATAAMLTTIMLAACNPSGKRSGQASMDSARNLNQAKFPDAPSKQAHAQYLMDVYASGLYEIKSSSEAMKRSGNEKIKKLAAFLISDHEAMNRQIDSLATSKQISLPGDLDQRQRKQLNTLLSKKGPDFDDDYLRQLTADQKAVLSLLEEAKTSDKPGIIDWVNETSPKIQKHLDMITACQRQLDSSQKK